jgi:hypothetical protein
MTSNDSLWLSSFPVKRRHKPKNARNAHACPIVWTSFAVLYECAMSATPCWNANDKAVKCDIIQSLDDDQD